jgi:hypothetical protein
VGLRPRINHARSQSLLASKNKDGLASRSPHQVEEQCAHHRCHIFAFFTRKYKELSRCNITSLKKNKVHKNEGGGDAAARGAAQNIFCTKKRKEMYSNQVDTVVAWWMNAQPFVRDWLLPTLCASVDTRRGMLVAVPLLRACLEKQEPQLFVAIDITLLHGKLEQLCCQDKTLSTGPELFRTLMGIPGATCPKCTSEWSFVTQVFSSDLEHGVVMLPVSAFSLLVHRTVVDGATRFHAIVNQLDDHEDPYASQAFAAMDASLMLETILPAFRSAGFLQENSCHSSNSPHDDFDHNSQHDLRRSQVPPPPLFFYFFEQGARCDIGPGFQSVPWVFYRTMEEKTVPETPQLRSLTPLTCSCPTPHTPHTPLHSPWSPRTPLQTIRI